MCDPVHDVNTAAMGFVWGGGRLLLHVCGNIRQQSLQFNEIVLLTASEWSE